MITKLIKHNSFFLFMILLIGGFNCSREKVFFENLVFKNLKYYNNGAVFSGKAYTYYDNGNIESVTLIANGVITDRKSFGYINDLISESQFFILNSTKYSMLVFIIEKEGNYSSKYIDLYYNCRLSSAEENMLKKSFLEKTNIDDLQLFNTVYGKPCN